MARRRAATFTGYQNSTPTGKELAVQFINKFYTLKEKQKKARD